MAWTTSCILHVHLPLRRHLLLPHFKMCLEPGEKYAIFWYDEYNENNGVMVLTDVLFST